MELWIRKRLNASLVSKRLQNVLSPKRFAFCASLVALLIMFTKVIMVRMVMVVAMNIMDVMVLINVVVMVVIILMVIIVFMDIMVIRRDRTTRIDTG